MFNQSGSFIVDCGKPAALITYSDQSGIVAEATHRFDSLEGNDTTNSTYDHAWRREFGMTLTQYFGK